MAYLLDTNVFIQAWHFNYRQNDCPEFWCWLKQMDEENRVYSVEEVYDEIERKDDGLADWIDSLSSHFFISTDNWLLSNYHEIAEWVEDQSYKNSAKRDFLKHDVADGFLIARAYLSGGEYKVVTEEKWSDSRHKVKIPNVCCNFNVTYMTTHEMLCEEQVPFALD